MKEKKNIYKTDDRDEKIYIFTKKTDEMTLAWREFVLTDGVQRTYWTVIDEQVPLVEENHVTPIAAWTFLHKFLPPQLPRHLSSD